jgi:hypothetical protein
MKEKLLAVCVAASSLLASSSLFAQVQSDTIKVSAVDSLSSKREEKNRNVMLNAENNNGPRSVNFGLPFGGDIVILENDVPVVYYFYPTVPTSAWRRDNSLAKMGLLSFAEGALTFGKVGFAVQSSDRDASSSFKGFASVYGNSFGSSRYDVTLTGPMGKKGWGYMASMYQNFDRGNGINYMFTPWYDRTQMAKFSIQKKYAKGSVRLLYKYVDSKQIFTNYSPLTYLADGETKPLDNFDLGKDSYIIRDGKVPYYDPYTGQPNWANLGDDNFLRSESHNLYLTGNHKFKNGWKLNYTSMWQYMNTPMSVLFPLSLAIDDADKYSATSYYTYQGTNKPYTGSVQTIISQLMPQTDNKYFVSRVEMTKKLKKHDVRIGATHQYNKRKLVTYGGTFMQTVEANPQLLDLYNKAGVRQTNDYGLRSPLFGGYGGLVHDTYNKLALYASDDIDITKWLNFSLGARIEHQNKKDERYADPQAFFNNNTLLKNNFKNKWNKVGIANAIVKLTGRFGLVGEMSYNSWHDGYWDYPYRTNIGSPAPDPATGKTWSTVPKTFNTIVMNYGGGVFYNAGDKLSIVSKFTRITKENNKYNNATITDPATRRRVSFDPIFYDISTLGWSTDIMATPFKNFTIHYLLTLQKPQYKNFKYGAFGVVYDYSNNIIPELSKVLMEIDPSYSFKDGALRAWFSLRYFGKQYANPTNAFFYKARLENFGGLDYRISRNIDLKFQVTNFLDQKGVKGAVQGADQITDASPYIGRKVVAGSIRPRTIELTANFKF